MDYQLSQRGRASIEFLVDLRIQSNRLEPQVDAYFEQKGIAVPASPAEVAGDYDGMQAQVLEKLQNSTDFRVLSLCREWMLEEHGRVAMDAFEDIRGAVTPALDALEQGSCTLEKTSFAAPAYWDGYEFHRSAGGWDGHDYMGFVHGELIHYHMVGKSLAGVLHGQRLAAAQQAPVDAPATILEIGCASGQFTQALAETYPDAQITALDMSLRQLQQTLRRGNEQHYHWQLLQAPAEASGLADDSFELVCSYAVFHELPVAVAEEVMREKFRLCRPGGVMLMADVKPYAAHKSRELWKADYWNQVVGGDPFWREYATTDFTALAESAGFVDVQWGGLGEHDYPYVLTGRKPG